MKMLKMGRYQTLVVVLTLFTAGTGAVLALNSMFASRAAESMEAVRAISQQRLQPRVIAAQAQIVKNDLGARRFLGRGLTELKNNVAAFDGALAQIDRFANADAGLSSVGYDPFNNAIAKRRLQELRQVWGEYHKLLRPIVGFAAGPYVETADRGTQLSAAGLRLNRELDQAARFGLSRHEDMAKLVSSLAEAVEQETSQRAADLRTYLFATLAVSAVLLIAVIFYFGRNLSRQEQSSTRAKKETDDILRTVNQGLFLLDKELKLGSERSEALERIFRRTDFDKLSFDGLLRGIVPEKTLETAMEYVRLLWGERVNEKLIKTINPLVEVEVHIDAGNGQLDTQYLEFDFNRVKADGVMSRLLVTVNDVTRRVHLARELLESQEKAQAQLDLLLHILHVDPRQLTGFLEESEVAMKMVNSILKEPAREETAFRAKLDGIFRQIHGVKGEAAALGLKTVESRAHGFEESLAELRSRPALSGNDFLPLVVKLDDLFGHLASVREMVGRLADLRVAMTSDDAPRFSEHDDTDIGPAGTLIQPAPQILQRMAEGAEAAGTLESSLKSLAAKVASEQSKQVHLVCSGLDNVPKSYRRAVKDITIQMVRNCVAHGIETPAERSNAAKDAAGTIVLKFESRADGYELVCQDDGRGLSTEKLKQTAIKRGLLSEEQAAQLDERRALSLIFMPGFSTQDGVTKDAGRGVGMDIVRNLVQELGGKVGVSTTVGRFARFRIWLPGATGASRAA
ncbi:MAG TPA: ATP-binding protein [Steroidobacteraceae bacterium]|nr:ATP-binding protein [Steroidobacteraceae bacterium]